MKLIFLTLIFCFSYSTYAYQNAWGLKIAGGLGHTSAQAGNEDNGTSFGVTSHFGRKWNAWEFNILSFVTIYKYENIKIFANDATIEGNGNFRSVSFGPQFKYYWETDYHPWMFYFGVSPIWGLQTYNYRNPNSSNTQIYQDGEKITYDSFGWGFVIGIEENLDKTSFPAFYEFSVKSLEARKGAVVGGKVDLQEVKLFVDDDEVTEVEELSFMFTIGLALF